MAWEMASTGVALGATSTRAGSCRIGSGDAHDVVGQGGREEHVLAFRRQQGQDATHVRPEAHVEHAVGFVEHEDLYVGEIDVAPLLQVEQATGGGHQEVDAPAQLLDLGLVAHAAVHGGDALAGVLRAVAGHVFDLAGQLAGGGDHRVPMRAASAHQLQSGQDEGGRLAGAGLGAAEDVTAGQGERDGLFLDGGRFGVAEAFDSLEQAWFQAKVGETHVVVAPCRASLWMHCGCRRS